MRDLCRRYPLFNVDVVSLDADEQFRFELQATSNFIACFVLQGSAARHQNDIGVPPLDGGFCVNPPEYGLYPMDLTAGPNGASWLCITHRVEGQYEAQHVNVAGDYTLPTGWGFAVAQGEVTADGKTATQGLYFGPRTTDVIVSGNADLILLR